MESFECIHFSIQGTRSRPTVQGHRKAGRIPGGSVLTIVLGLRGGLGADRSFLTSEGCASIDAFPD
jgi:hypothetical protein